MINDGVHESSQKRRSRQDLPTPRHMLRTRFIALDLSTYLSRQSEGALQEGRSAVVASYFPGRICKRVPVERRSIAAIATKGGDLPALHLRT